MTRNRVMHAPVKAKAGTETKAALKFNKMALLAPNAAPAETPKV